MPEMSPATALLFLREEELRQGYDLLFQAYRDIEADADALLAEFGLARGHHHALHFVGRAGQCSVSELQTALGITLQSLGRLLRELVERDLVQQRTGPEDRRQRILSLTEPGKALEKQLWDRHRARIVNAYRDSGPQSVDGFRRVLAALARRPDPRVPAGPGLRR